MSAIDPKYLLYFRCSLSYLWPAGFTTLGTHLDSPLHLFSDATLQSFITQDDVGLSSQDLTSPPPLSVALTKDLSFLVSEADMPMPGGVEASSHSPQDLFAWP